MNKTLLLLAFIAVICLVKISFFGVAIYPENRALQIEGEVEINTTLPIEVEVRR